MAEIRDPRGLDDTRIAGALWFAMLGPALAWAIGFAIDYGLVHLACARQSVLPLHLVTLVFVAIAVSAGGVAHREWRRVGGGRPGEEPPPDGRARFMAAFGMLASGFFTLVLLAQWAAKLFFNPCMGI